MNWANRLLKNYYVLVATCNRWQSLEMFCNFQRLINFLKSEEKIPFLLDLVIIMSVGFFLEQEKMNRGS